MQETTGYAEKAVLLIDDNDIDNFINERTVRANHYAETAYVCTSSESALEFLRNLAANPSIGMDCYPSVIFLDINMPMLDGFQFLAELEKFDFDFVKELRVIMLTSSINPADRERSTRSRLVKGFLQKPLTEEMLKQLVGDRVV